MCLPQQQPKRQMNMRCEVVLDQARRENAQKREVEEKMCKSI